MASDDCGGRITKKAKVDRISNLPDEIISQILSLLPTKCAVGTSILSNRWKYLWTSSITSLHFENPFDEDNGFTNFGDNVFRSCNSSNIQKLTLHVPLCYYYKYEYNSRVVAWIDEAIKRNVREVDIIIPKLPLSLFKCTTLKELKLVPNFDRDPVIYSFDLPCLKVLYIHIHDCYSMKTTEKLIRSCPVLEDLTLEGNFVAAWLKLYVPTLKSLRIQLGAKGYLEIYVKTPNLEYLYLGGYFVKYKIKGDFSSLVKANVDIEDIHLCSRYNPFHLERRALPYDYTLPKFDNLKSLDVITCHHLFWVMLPKLIRISRSLEVLSITQHGHKMPPDEYTWVGPKLVPKCLRFHLTTIKLEGFKGRKHELELLRYLLGNAKVLRKLIINCQGLKCVEKMEFSEQLLKISKASRCCQIKFHGDLISD